MSKFIVGWRLGRLWPTATDGRLPHSPLSAPRAPNRNYLLHGAFSSCKNNTMNRSSFMYKFAAAGAVVMIAASAAYAQQNVTPPAAHVLNALPTNSGTVTNYYKQDVYDPSD